MEVELGEFLLLAGLSIIAAMYASVGHGGASGYLAVLSLTAYAANDQVWLKQHAWSLNLLVAGIAFYAYKKSGFFDIKLALPFIVSSVPAAFIGGYLRVDSTVYDILLSLTLVFASWKIYSSKKSQFTIEVHDTPSYFKDIHKYHQIIYETDLANNFSDYYKNYKSKLSKIMQNAIANGRKHTAKEYAEAIDFMKRSYDL